MINEEKEEKTRIKYVKMYIYSNREEKEATQ